MQNLLSRDLAPMWTAALIVLTTAGAATLSLPVEAVPGSHPSVAAAPSVARLKKSDDPWDFLKNPTVQQSMKTAMGNKYSLILKRTENLDMMQVSGDQAYTQGGVSGMFTIQETAFSYDLNTKASQVALLDDTVLNVWGASNADALSPPIKKFIADLKERTKEQNKSIKVLFKAPGESSIKVASR